MSRQAAITDAAIAALAAEGMRGLTHRAVDRAAGLPEGSTSYYFRTRHALLAATVERLVELDAAEMPAIAASGRDDLADAAATLLHAWMTVGRQRQLARYELMLEATRRTQLRVALNAAAANVRAMVASLLATAGIAEADRKAYELAALLDGLVFDQVAGARAGSEPPGIGELRGIVGRLLAAVVTPSRTSGR